MKNILKISLLFILIIFLSGCSATENISVANSGVTDENFKVFSNNEDYYFQEDPVSDYIDSRLSIYKEKLEQSGYNYDIYTTMDNSGVEINKTYDNICNYFNNSLFIKKLYGSVICTETENNYEIISSSNLLYNGNDSDNYLLDKFDNVSFSLKTDLYIDDQNADKVEENVYIWNFKRSNLNKAFRLKIQKGNLTGNIVKPKKDSKTAIIVVGIIVLFLLFISFVLYIKNKKRKIDY